MAKTRREFTPEFKREPVALLESSGRPQMQIAAELGIQPSMLRQWWATLNGAASRPRPGTLPSLTPATPVSSSPDQAAEIAKLRRELDRTRMQRDVLESDRPLRGDAEVRLRFIEQHARPWPVRLMCRVLQVSPSGYYGWRSRSERIRPAANRQLLEDVRCIHAGHHGRYGSPRVHAVLRAEGRSASCGRVERLMRRCGIRALAGWRCRPCTTDSRHDLPIAPNLLKQKVLASVPNTVWFADIPYLLIGEGWRYLAAVLDLATRKVVGWSMRDHARTELTTAALMMAGQRQKPAAGLVCHSDRGSQYAVEAYRKQLAGMKAVPSMSRTAYCYDNAPMESCFHTLMVELVHQRRWATRDEARRDLFAYIEGSYDPQRIHSALASITPEQAEQEAS